MMRDGHIPKVMNMLVTTLGEDSTTNSTAEATDLSTKVIETLFAFSWPTPVI